MKTRKKVALVLVLAVILACVGCYVALHPAWRYQGGPITDNGVVSYPRFVAAFSPMPFNTAGSKIFTFYRFPAERAAVVLKTPAAPDRESLERLGTRITIAVQDERGNYRCRASGSPAGKGADQAFVTSAPIHATQIWLMPCAAIDLSTCAPCKMSVTIASIDPATPDMQVVPALEGGGIELP